MESPQETSLEFSSSGEFEHENIHHLNRKRSRTLLYIRNRASPGSVSVSMVGIVLTIISTHGLFSLYMTHRRWINAPITYMDRTCPSAAYTTLKQHSDAGKICLTTLTDAKSTSRFQRFCDGVILTAFWNWPGKTSWSTLPRMAMTCMTAVTGLIHRDPRLGARFKPSSIY